MAVDPLGLLLTVVVQAAGISDSRGARCLLIRLFRGGFHLVKLFVDGGSKTGLLLWAKALLGSFWEVVQRASEKGFQVAAQRWIVERSFAWLLFQRRFAKADEHHPQTSETMLSIASSTLMLRRLHPL
jgi:transposase